MNILQSIFTDHYEHILYLPHPRKSFIENIDRMISCGNHSQGGTMFGYPVCGNLYFVAFTCKSRFCPSCGNKYNHLRFLLNCLFHAVRDVVLRMFFKMSKAELFTSDFICVLHTLGRDLKWNPHIHALISEGGAGNITAWRPVKHFDYTFLRNAFRKVLLGKMTFNLGPSFKKIKNKIYNEHTQGFYVFAKPSLASPDHTIKYISQFLGRPVIATSRIDSYDSEYVTFHYTRHEDHKAISEHIPALDFIKRLIIHIPESILKCSAIMKSIPNIIHRRNDFEKPFLLKNTDSFSDILIGEI